jgi:hypothetical protein
MKRVAFAAVSMLMLSGIVAGSLQTAAPTAAVPQQPTVVLADTTAPPPLCDPTYTKCKFTLARPESVK